MSSLYEIASVYMDFLRQVEDGKIPGEAILDTLEALEGEFSDKLDNVSCLIKSIESGERAIKAEEDALAARRRAKEAHASLLRRYVKDSLLAANKTGFESPRNKLSFRASSGVVIADEDRFKAEHPELCKNELVVKIQLEDIKKQLKAGAVISGAVLEVRQNLQIK